ncbi:deleted in malignant brain tumors 1 protein-like [Strongylocentrotus purpuratus]|uniref:SRCR domain-containing protein n=1 Tax=Strongylocentrotus purpuratus TaxID=7668 RepID=A0A7M7PKD0_STRPU|nr:deleted in malignant brain tumors 1 protein-like [Strongylocentrotus purpuratus]
MVCRMLGFDGALDATREARFGQGSGDILHVNCWGTEDSLADCFDLWPDSSCGHHRDASAVCYSGVRLVSGSNDAEGRVEVLYDGSWGTVCDDNWDLRDARVVCRMLGFDGALDAPGSARFGQGGGRSLLVYVECDGTEDNLADCAHAWVGRYKCSHAEDAGAVCYSGDNLADCAHAGIERYSCSLIKDAGAICYSGNHPNPFHARLVGGSNDAEGRVEVLNSGSWRTICDNWWDLRDARVVCRMLGFDGALDAPGSAWFGQGSGRILLKYVNCDGTEDNLADCAHSGIGLYSCSHTRDAGAICYSGTHPNPFQVHLVGGSNDAEGRVEVMYDGSWGTICDYRWDLRDARVVCRMLGFDGALNATGSARFGQGSGGIFLAYVGCEGTEDNLAGCSHRGIGDHDYCGHSRDAGAICYSGAHPNPFQIRLANGSNDAEGRVEVQYDGSWGTICNSWWDLRDARVVCRMLGFDGALDAPRSAKFGQGSGRVLLSYVGCDGTEDNLADCAHAGIERYLCRQTRDAGAICYSGIHPKPFQVRLVGGSNDAEGRVELNHNGSWGTICDYLWDLRDARVVCRMAGFDGALDAPGSARFGQGSGRILLKYVTCDGNEENLVDCAHAGIERYSCSHTRDSGVICYSGIHPKPFQVRLVGGSNDAEGRVELKHNGSWGTICDDLWDLRDARVVCKMGGFDGALDAPRSARFGQGSGRSLLKYVNCDGTEDNLADCAHAGIGRYICSHTRDAGAVCYSGAAPGSARFGAGSGEILFDDVGCKGTEDALAECYHRGLGINNCEHDRDAGVICFTGDPFKVRLTDGANDSEGRVEVMYNGSWGTVCDNGWDTNDARVVCRMLGFDGALAATVSARFVRLIGGTNDAEGRVEILHDGSWGTVCDDSWDLKDAEVVCKMLSFEGALDAPLGARFGKGSGSIFLDEVQCHGTETDIERCDHDGIGINNCAHNEDASVICIQKDPFQVRLVGGSNDAKGRVEVMYDGSWGTICDGDWDLRDARVVCRMLGFDGALDAPRSARFDPFQVRLGGGSNDAKGRVEVLYDGSWGTICDGGWDLRDARVVCRMLGYDGALDAPISARFGQGSGRILLANVNCKGIEDNLADCAHAGIGDYTSCGHEKDAGVICYSGVRLVGGSNDAEGRVEVLHEGSWGTICDDWWDLRDARVVCRMLGFDGTLEAKGSARFSQGSGDILLDDVGCDGTEDNLADCAHLGIRVHNCGHGEDAGTICYSGKRLSAVVSSRKQKSQVALTVNKNTTGEQVHIRGDSGQNATHEYMDMNTIRERLPSSKDEDIDGYLLPTATTPEPRVYMEIGTTTADEARVQTNAKMAVTGVSLGDDKVKVARSSPDMQYDIIPDYTNITTA